jgi:hypothetical protein
MAHDHRGTVIDSTSTWLRSSVGFAGSPVSEDMSTSPSAGGVTDTAVTAADSVPRLWPDAPDRKALIAPAQVGHDRLQVGEVRGAEATPAQADRTDVEVVCCVDHGHDESLRGDVIAVARHGIGRARIHLAGAEVQRPSPPM